MADNVKKLILVNELRRQLQYVDCWTKMPPKLRKDHAVIIVTMGKGKRDILCDILNDIKDLK